MGRKYAILRMVMILCFTGCSQVQQAYWDQSEGIVFMSWNVENLFDAVHDGDEYYEYDPGNGIWDAAGYHQRLSRIRDVIINVSHRGPDVMLFQEIEHEGVLRDLVNHYLRGMGYDFVASSSVPGTAVEVGIISRIPITDVRYHFSRIGDHQAPRPVMEVRLDTPLGYVYVFNGHWKSKIGGAQQTEMQRIASSSALRRRMEEIRSTDTDAYIIIGGDMNETPWEPRHYETALRILESPDDHRYTRSILLTWDSNEVSSLHGVLYSPWLEPKGLNMDGTYRYRGSWEAIDHFMVCENFFSQEGLEYEHTRVVVEGMLDESGGPSSWDLYSRVGISDHLPLVLYGKVIVPVED